MSSIIIENSPVAGGLRTLAQLEPPWQESADNSQIHFNEENVPKKPRQLSKISLSQMLSETDRIPPLKKVPNLLQAYTTMIE